MILNAQQILAIAQAAGWQGSMARVATAIALAESKGDIFAIGDKLLAWTNGPAIGLWQINIAKHDDARAEGFNLFTPEVNAEHAFKIYTAANSNFKPWSTFTNGDFQAYLATVPNG